jgi:hypothetical protein
MRLLNIQDGYSSGSAPSTTFATTMGFATYANDAAFVTAKGSAAAEGDAYANTTDHSIHYYNGTAWEIYGSFNPNGTRAAPNSIIAASGISVQSFQRQIQFIQGSGGAVTVTANPQIQAGSRVGQELNLIGRSDTNTVKLQDGTGLSLNGPITMGADYSLRLMWDGTNWVEVSRREN